MNKHGLKQKKKTMIRLLRELGEKKNVLEKQLSNVKDKIYRLETAKNKCSKQIREL